MKVLCTNGPWTLPLCPHIWEPLQLTLSLPFPHHFCAIQKTWRLRQFWRTWKNVDKTFWIRFRTSSVQFSCSVVSNTLRPHESQHARPPCPSPAPGVHPDSCALSRWCHPAISSSVTPFSSRLQSFPASGSSPVSQFFASGGERIGASASASVLPMNIQDWSPLGWTGWISLQSKGLSRVFSNTTVQKHQFFGAQLSSPTLTSMHDYWGNHSFD